MKKILVPIDFSDTAGDAMNLAAEFCELIDGEITLLHILEYPESTFIASGEVQSKDLETLYQAEFIKAVHLKLEQWTNMLEQKGLQVKSMMKYGHAYTSISQTITELGADLIIMGSKGASGLREMLVGSNAARTVRYAKCPVIIVKGETHLKDFKRLVFATDGGDEQDEIVDKVKYFQRLLNLNLHILNVRNIYNRSETKEIEQLRDFVERSNFENYVVSSINADDVEDGALKYAETSQSQLVVIGTHGRKGLWHLIGGSITESIVNESDIPVMSLSLNS